jgi:hypothetical protein
MPGKSVSFQRLVQSKFSLKFQNEIHKQSRTCSGNLLPHVVNEGAFPFPV